MRKHSALFTALTLAVCVTACKQPAPDAQLAAFSLSSVETAEANPNYPGSMLILRGCFEAVEDGTPIAIRFGAYPSVGEVVVPEEGSAYIITRIPGISEGSYDVSVVTAERETNVLSLDVELPDFQSLIPDYTPGALTRGAVASARNYTNTLDAYLTEVLSDTQYDADERAAMEAADETLELVQAFLDVNAARLEDMSDQDLQVQDAMALTMLGPLVAASTSEVQDDTGLPLLSPLPDGDTLWECFEQGSELLVFNFLARTDGTLAFSQSVLIPAFEFGGELSSGSTDASPISAISMVIRLTTLILNNFVPTDLDDFELVQGEFQWGSESVTVPLRLYGEFGPQECVNDLPPDLAAIAQEYLLGYEEVAKAFELLGMAADLIEMEAEITSIFAEVAEQTGDEEAAWAMDTLEEALSWWADALQDPLVTLAEEGIDLDFNCDEFCHVSNLQMSAAHYLAELDLGIAMCFLGLDEETVQSVLDASGLSTLLDILDPFEFDRSVVTPSSCSVDAGSAGACLSVPGGLCVEVPYDEWDSCFAGSGFDVGFGAWVFAPEEGELEIDSWWDYLDLDTAVRAFVEAFGGEWVVVHDVYRQVRVTPDDLADCKDEDGDGYVSQICWSDPDDAPLLSEPDECDEDPSRNPGVSESDDGAQTGIDDNCNGEVDEGTLYYDADGDCYCPLPDGSGACTGTSSPTDCSTILNGDCDDSDAEINPGAEDKVYDGIDSDCDEREDFDFDGDGWISESFCSGTDCDCNDFNSMINPGGIETCSTADDDNCDDSSNDEGATGCTNLWADADGDGFGDAADGTCICQAEGLYIVENDSDCDDDDDYAFPGAAESESSSTCMADHDEDGWGDESPSSSGATAGNDCDDDDATTNPSEVEWCDSVDHDCDGSDYDGAVDGDTWYRDADGDGYGDSSNTTTACDADPPTGYLDSLSRGEDCDDDEYSVNPGATEVCDGVDNNCSAGISDEECECSDAASDRFKIYPTAVLTLDASLYVTSTSNMSFGMNEYGFAYFGDNIFDSYDPDCYTFIEAEIQVVDTSFTCSGCGASAYLVSTWDAAGLGALWSGDLYTDQVAVDVLTPLGTGVSSLPISDIVELWWDDHSMAEGLAISGGSSDYEYTVDVDSSACSSTSTGLCIWMEVEVTAP